ncbi:MAG TPA: DnaA/Hda family protein [Urbifossiella sp.]|nr:DnaA/Hda family protein [Urbifossiella sp.]
MQSPRSPAAPPAPPPPLDRAVADAVAARIGAARYTLWFQGHTRFVGLGSELVVVARNDSCRDWLEHTFGDAVRAAAAEAPGGPLPVRWVVDADAFVEKEDKGQKAEDRGPRKADAAGPRVDAPHATTRPKAAPSAPREQTDLFGDPVPSRKPKPKRPDPEAVGFDPVLTPRAGRRWKTLADFVVGPCNRVAHASAVAVVEDPGQGANPLVLHGPTGVGKTHLLEGVFLGLKRAGEKPCYVTAEEFTTRFVQASRLGKMGAFRRQFRECSALLLDNLNFLATKRATQEEFLNTFDSLVADGRQVVVTTDCHPRLADDLMPELADRLLGGAVWGLLPPDPDTRLGILRKRAGAAGPPVPDAVLKYLAGHLRGNARELEGAVNSVRHYAKVTGRPADAALAREALGDLLRHAVRVVTVADVDAAVCTALRLSTGTLQSKARTWAVTHPRMVAVFLCRKHTAATYGEISKHFGAKTHSTAVAAEKKVRAWLAADARVAIGDRDWPAKELVDRVERELQR